MLLFHSPTAVGVMYPDYFKDMPLTVVAFCLVMVRLLFSYSFIIPRARH